MKRPRHKREDQPATAPIQYHPRPSSSQVSEQAVQCQPGRDTQQIKTDIPKAEIPAMRDIVPFLDNARNHRPASAHEIQSGSVAGWPGGGQYGATTKGKPRGYPEMQNGTCLIGNCGMHDCRRGQQCYDGECGANPCLQPTLWQAIGLCGHGVLLCVVVRQVPYDHSAVRSARNLAITVFCAWGSSDTEAIHSLSASTSAHFRDANRSRCKTHACATARNGRANANSAPSRKQAPGEIDAAGERPRYGWRRQRRPG